MIDEMDKAIAQTETYEAELQLLADRMRDFTPTQNVIGFIYVAEQLDKIRKDVGDTLDKLYAKRARLRREEASRER